MKRFITVLMLVLAVAAAMPVLAQERVDSKVRFNDLYGEVSIRPNDEEDDAYEFAEIDTIIYENDRIRTKEESGAILSLEDMSTFVLKPESILIIRAEEENTTKMEMLAGRIIGNIKKMAEGKSMDFEMSQCVAGIKGTAIQLTQSKDGFVNRVDVIRGEAVVTAKASRIAHQVMAGESITIDNKGEAVKSNIDADALKKLIQTDCEKMDEKLNDEELLKKLNDKSSYLQENIKNFTDRYNSLMEKVNASSNDTKLLLDIAALRREVERFTGEIDEAKAVIAVANNRQSNKVFDSPAAEKVYQSNAKKMTDAVDSLSKQCQDLLNLYAKIANFEKETKEAFSRSSKAEPQTIKTESPALESIKKIESIRSVVKDIIDEAPDESSYVTFKDARLKCEDCLKDLTYLQSEITSIANEGANQSEISELNRKYKEANDYIQEAITRFASVSEIANDTIKNMNDIEKLIPDYASKVREYLAEYNAIDKSSTDAKKRYVTAVSKLLVSYDRTKRQYAKANRMYLQTVKDFKKSSFKTSEYNEIVEAWDRIESAMTELDSESEELSSCVDALKSQLDDMLGQ